MRLLGPAGRCAPADPRKKSGRSSKRRSSRICRKMRAFQTATKGGVLAAFEAFCFFSLLPTSARAEAEPVMTRSAAAEALEAKEKNGMFEKNPWLAMIFILPGRRPRPHRPFARWALAAVNGLDGVIEAAASVVRVALRPDLCGYLLHGTTMLKAPAFLPSRGILRGPLHRRGVACRSRTTTHPIHRF